jgi:hypothetical protein
MENNTMPRRKYYRRQSSYSSRSSLGATLRRPLVQVTILIVIGLIVFLIASLGGEQAKESGSLPASVSVEEAYQMYQDWTCAHPKNGTNSTHRIPP